MDRVIEYIPPKSLEELQDFQKLNYYIKGEIWKSVTFDMWEGFKISNYGRLFNIKTKKLRKCFTPGVNVGDKFSINSISHVNTFNFDGKKISVQETICDMMLYAFYPDMADTHINPIPRDGNKFNFHLSNIKFVPNSYYVSDGSKEKWIWHDGEKTNYTVDIYGTIINRKTDRIMSSHKHEAYNHMALSHKGKKLGTSTRIRCMAQAFIPNPNNLNYAAIIDPKNTKLHISNICWTDRKKLVKK